MKRVAGAIVVVAVAFTLVMIVSRSALEAQAGAQQAFKPPRGLESQAIPVPADNPMTAGKIRLGDQLFFDKRLSKTKQMSCETCHVPEKGWTDGLPLSPRFDGSMNTRHTPTLYEAAYYPDLYWDGRAKGLEAQILAAWRGQMGGDPDAMAKEIDGVAAYNAQFQKEFGGGATGDRIVKALATFVRTIHAGDTRYDRDATNARSEAAQGFKVFSEVAECTLCHLPPVFSDTLFHNVGVGSQAEKPDRGRGGFLSDAAQKDKQPVPPETEKLMGAFKTPTMRGIALSGPYFHDGSVKTLEEVVDQIVKGGIPNKNLDEKMKPHTLTAAQRKLLLAFLRSLTPSTTTHKRPTIP